MKNLKMSDFKKFKVVTFDEYGLINEEQSSIIGTLEFYSLNSGIVQRIQKELEQIKDDDNAYNTFFLIKYCTNIEMDVNIQEFKNIIEYPNQNTRILLSGIQELIDSLYQDRDDIKRIEDNSKELYKKVTGQDIEEDFINKSLILKEKLNKLYNDISTAKDNKERDSILNKIIKIKDELNDLDKGEVNE